jgi:hypothetical protein
MSHFSQIKTQIRNLTSLQAALTEMGIDWKEGPRAVRGYKGQTYQAEVAIEQENGYDLGFSWNGEQYELVADLQFWSSITHPRDHHYAKRGTAACTPSALIPFNSRNPFAS